MLLFAVGTNVQAGWVLAVAALLLGVLVAGVVLPLQSLRGITVERVVPKSATAGQHLPVTLSVTNSGRRLRGLFRISDRFCGPGWAVVGALPAGATRGFESWRTEARRGVHTEGEVVLESGLPFGVVRIRRPQLVASTTVVYPQVYEVPLVRSLGASTWFAPSAVGDVSSVRDYRPGDPLRHIHWRSVARHGQLMVREFDHERHTEAAVVALPSGDADIADVIATVACSLALPALRDGDVMLVGSSKAGLRAVKARSRQAVLDWGAYLEAASVRMLDAVDATGDVAAVLVVAPTSRSDLGALVQVASSKHVQVVLIVDDELVTGRAANDVKAAGVPVSIVRPAEVVTWLQSGSATD
jgi:uncharacterized protein (DUF58 family)